MGEQIRIEQFEHKGDFGGYLALPESGSGPGIVLIQEIFGVNAGIRTLCDSWAAKGFVTLAPDLFWRVEPGVELDSHQESGWKKAVELAGQFDTDAGVKDIAAAIRAVRARPECTGKVGVMGFCIGGLMTYLAATRTDADACSSYYGGSIQNYLGEQHAIGKPLLLHIGTDDEYIDKDARAAIHAALDPNPHATVYDYPGARHAFARVGGEHRIEEAAQLADARTLELFKLHLG